MRRENGAGEMEKGKWSKGTGAGKLVQRKCRETQLSKGIEAGETKQGK